MAMKFGDQAPMAHTSPAGAKQIQLPAARTAVLPIQVNQWVRNTKHPNAELESRKSEAANQWAMWRTKCVFASPGGLGTIAVGGGVRWRHAWHSGPYARFLVIKTVTFVNAGSVDANTKYDVTDVNGTVLVTDTFHWGSAAATGSGLENYVIQTKFLTISPDTDYYALFTDDNTSAWLQSACVYEMSSLTELNAGYLPQNFVCGGPILQSYRQNLASLARNMWRRGGAHLMNWSAGGATGSGGSNITSAALINIADRTSTSNTYGGAGQTSSPGYLLDLTMHSRKSQVTTGVSVAMKAFCKVDNPVNTGTVSLVDTSGTTLLSCTTNAATAGWVSASGMLPATIGKYDLMAKTTGGTVTVYTVSIYEYDT